MINLDCESSVYNNMIEYYFHEFFELREIDISGLNYKQVSNSLWEAAFSHVYQKLFKPDKPQKNNRKTLINLDDINELSYVYEIYENLCKSYDIVAFQRFFCKLTGINNDTIFSWYNKEYHHNGQYILYSELARKIKCIPGEQIQNKLSDDKLGIQSLANNDDDVGLLYNQKSIYDKARAEQAAKISINDLHSNLKIEMK